MLRLGGLQLLLSPDPKAQGVEATRYPVQALKSQTVAHQVCLKIQPFSPPSNADSDKQPQQ